jgi:hypothetical protein
MAFAAAGMFTLPADDGCSRRGALAAQRTPGSVATSSLVVNENGRHLQRDGAPFFWLGDTGWLLFQSATREDAEFYLERRAEQGFTVIQAAIVMGEEIGVGAMPLAGTLKANVYGDQAFVAGDPTRPALTAGSDPRLADEYDYWDHVDYIVERASAHGLTLALAPLFVGYTGPGYRYLTPERSFDFGLFLGRRYGGAAHVIWILGGDNTPSTAAAQHLWNELARGITVGTAGGEDYERTLMTYHINGDNSSSLWFHDAAWLDFNMVQVWGKEPQIYPHVLKDYQLAPVRPTGLGEGSYEDSPQYPTRPIDSLKVRQQAYWSYFAGGYHTYGNTNVWNFGTYTSAVTDDWRRAVESEGARHLSVLARLWTSLPWWTFEPAPTLVDGASAIAGTVAIRSTTGELGLVYLPASSTATVNLTTLARVSATATWIDPRTGAATAAGRASGTTASFRSPPGWVDALLLLEARE